MRICTVCEKTYEDDVLLCPDDGAQTASGGAAKAEDADPLLGRMIGSYKISKLLGKGGMGAVYAAEHPAIGSKVAIKFLHEQFARDKGIVTRFFNEAKAVNVINHDNIVKVVDYAYLDEKMPYFVMEMLGNGYEMGKLAKGPVTLEVAGPIVLQVCDALAAAHGNSIIHRDLKPDNIYLAERSGRKHFVKLMDFGIAKLAGGVEGQGQTQTGMVMGTPHYMSPEQASGQTSKIDGRSDIYSLGIIMYQLATGELPFKGDSFAETLVMHLTSAPRPPRELVPSIPASYEQVILKAIAKKPEERYQNTRELANDVAVVMKTLGLSFELPLADDASPQAAGQSVSTIHLGSAAGPASAPPTRLSATVADGTQILPPNHGARPSAAMRAGVWIAGLALGFGLVVGLRKARVITHQGDALTTEIASLQKLVDALPPLPAPPDPAQLPPLPAPPPAPAEVQPAVAPGPTEPAPK